MLPSQRRVVLALAVTFALLGAMVTYSFVRLMKWHRSGWAGFQYIQVYGTSEKPPPVVFGMKPGQITVVYPSGPADRAGLRVKDQILAINGVALTETDRLLAIDDRIKTGDVVSYTVERGKQTLTRPVRIASPLESRHIVVTGLVSGFVALVFISVGLVVFVKRPDDRRVIVFFAMVMLGAVSLLTSPVTYLDSSSLRGIAPQPRSFASALFMAFVAIPLLPLTLHLTLIFPEDRPSIRKNPRLTGWIYGIPVTAMLVTAASAAMFMMLPTIDETLESLKLPLNIASGIFTLLGLAVALRIARRGRTEGTLKAFASRPFQSLFVFYAFLFGAIRISAALGLKIVTVTLFFLTFGIPFIVIASYPILSCIALYRSYRDAGVEQRRQVKWPLWGTFIALATRIIVFTLTSILSFVLFARSHDMSAWMDFIQLCSLIPTVAYLLIPISFAVAILKYRLMNIDVIIKKTVAYTILSGLIVVLYIVLVGGLGTILINFAGLKNQTMVIMSTLVVAILFVPLRNQLQRMVDKNLFRQKTDYPQALRSLATDTLSATDSFAFLFLASETIQQALQNRSVVIFTRRGDELVATAKVGVADSLLGSLRFPAEAGDAIERPLDPRRSAIPESSANAFKRVEAALVVPIRSKGVTHGVIALGSKLSDREFDLEDLEFLSSVANQIAIALDRIRLGREEVDFEQARVMQQGLLPASMPVVEGLDVSGMWEPARAVGGDYYDVLQLAPTQLGVCIGDVAGKGMPAALLMSALQAAVRASATENISPRELCERVRRVVVPSLGGRFVSFFFCTIDTQQQRIRFCNAGHNAPILARADGSVVRLEKGGPVFSRLMSNTRYEEGEHELSPGDRVVLFTDGVSEARDTEENDFGEDRLERLAAAHRNLGARELLARIIEEVSSFTGGRTEDDLTLVAVAVTKRA